MKRLAIVLSLAASLLTIAFGQVPNETVLPVDDVHDFIILKDRAFVVGKPILVAGPTSSEPSWSPTGQFLVYLQNQGDTNVLGVQDSVKEQRIFQTERTLHVYSLSTGKSVEVMRFTSVQHPQLYWITGSDRALIDTQRIVMDDRGVPTMSDTLYVLDAVAGTMREFTPWEGDGSLAYAMIIPSPVQP